MNLLIAPDSFKGSLSAKEVARAMERAAQSVLPSLKTYCIPFSDGGEGALDFLESHFTGDLQWVDTQNALGHPLRAPYYKMGSKAWIELSQIAGLSQLSLEERNPLLTSTYGVGILIKEALNNGCDEIYLSIGGSATHDMGFGIFCGMGGLALDATGNSFIPTGKTLGTVASIDRDKISIPMKSGWLHVICDVSNPPVGPQGAATIFAPQKGATPEQCAILEENSQQLIRILQPLSNQPLASLEGGGAAGGTAAGMVTLFNASLQSGFETFYRWSGLEDLFQKSSLLLTGEGCLDHQSLLGKVPLSLAKKAHLYRVPTLVVCGQIQLDIKTLEACGIVGWKSLLEECESLEYAQKKPFEAIEKVTQKLLISHFKIKK
ncbi:MAG: glycerate kinase [Flavobacteriaceae bacterium TMED120]|nr:MAG: glycerate kinase [Flavobacteriaceae bacterium TMED120]HCQ24636.1 glycerate kinase [Flavobacteriaceae bacterium]|tara:strand:+ start:50763 stop:51893 length:1131 start_codon:yes stop_codon:yes gene_type:complete